MDLNGLKVPYLDVSVLFWEKRGESHSQWRESSEWPKEEQGEERRGLLRVLYDQIWERHKGEFHVRCYKKTCSIEDYQAVIYTCILIYRNLFYCLSKCSFISDHCQPIVYNWPFFLSPSISWVTVIRLFQKVTNTLCWTKWSQLCTSTSAPF